MNKTWVLSALLFLALSGCKSKAIEIPELPEESETEQIKKQDFVETAPAYGVYSGGAFQVNVEAEDAPSVQPGQAVEVRPIPGNAKVAARVSRILRNASAETRQGIAWLQPVDPAQARKALSDGDFVFATITLRVKHAALAIPRDGVFVKDSKTWAIVKDTDEKGKTTFKPVEIEIGTTSMDLYEILKGLSEGQTVATGGALGYLYPDFKAASED